MSRALLAYACPGGRRRCSEGRQAKTSEFILRRPGACFRCCGWRIEGNSLRSAIPSRSRCDRLRSRRHRRFPQMARSRNLPVADTARDEPGQVLRDHQRSQRVSPRHHADRQPLSASTGNVDADVDGSCWHGDTPGTAATGLSVSPPNASSRALASCHRSRCACFGHDQERAANVTWVQYQANSKPRDSDFVNMT